MNNNYKKINCIWFTPGVGSKVMLLLAKNNPYGIGTIGIVAVDAGHNRWRAFIGLGLGFDEEEDIQDIIDWGACLEEPWARAFFPDINMEYRR
jgi:hypothetical protein